MTRINLEIFYMLQESTYNGNEVRCEAFIVIEYLLNILLALLFNCFC